MWCGKCTAHGNHNVLTSTADNDVMDMYIDGVRVDHMPYFNNWVQVDSVTLKPWVSVIAVRATNWHVLSNAGVVASDTHGRVRTNAATWKCRNTPSNRLDFNQV